MDEPKKPRKKVKEPSPNERLVEEFIKSAIRAGMPKDQTANFINSAMVLQPKQCQMAAAARNCDIRCPACQELYSRGQPIIENCKDCGPIYVGVGGARGGGKSAWMVAQVALDDCVRFPGLKFLYVRKSAKTLRTQMRDLLRKTCQAGTYNYREQLGEVEFKNGSMIIIRHFKDESEIDNFLGEEYDGIAYEELTTLSEDKFKNLNSCLRTSKVGWRPRVYASWNWGGIGHSWTKKFFYDPWKNKQEITTRYILALVSDNKHNNPEYINQLKQYAGWKYQSWYLGNPDLAVGNFFANFREDVHVFPNESVKLVYQDIVRWFGSMDYGSSHPNCFHLHCENSYGDCFTVAELHTIGNTISENASEFKDVLRLHNLEPEDLEFIAVGHDVLKTDRQTNVDGSTVLTEYGDNGLEMTAVHINRVNAWSQMQERLGNPERGIRPTWFIHKSCVNLISQVMTAQCDEKKPNDILKMNADKETGEGGDDALEGARNGLTLAYNNLLKDARPVQMGSFKPMSEIQEPDYIDIDAQIVEAERLDREKRGIFVA